MPRHLFRRVERIDIDQHTARFQNTKCNHGTGKPVGHLQSDAIPLREPGDLSQVDGEGVRHLVHLIET